MYKQGSCCSKCFRGENEISMILLIDNYDSFSYNLYQLIGTINSDIKVIRNDQMNIEEINKLSPECIILSPGPGRPKGAGICIEVVKKMYQSTKILGVCLGHQAICEAFGGEIIYAERLMHGKQSIVKIDNTDPIFYGLPDSIPVARYHSLVASKNNLPICLNVLATTDDGEIMAVKHNDYPVYGLQFHPESIMTPDGKNILKNFLGGV